MALLSALKPAVLQPNARFATPASVHASSARSCANADSTQRAILVSAPCPHATSNMPCSSSAAHKTTRAARLATHAGSGSASSTQHSPRLQQVLAKIDDLNSQDPRSVQVDGQAVPYELAYSRWLTDWVTRLTQDDNPAVSEELLIVARGQHVQRWTSPRSSYPEGRAAYLKWREDLKKFHARTVTGIMAEAGYPPESLDKVESMILKKNLKESENQTIEDALCLVFMERQFTELLAKEGEDKMVDIVKKTWRKMGPKGRDAALTLKLSDAESRVVQRALAA